MTGQISDTYLHQIARDAAADGRPLVVFTFSDCDPAGYWDMPTAIGRKLQALKDLLFPTLEFKVVHAGLSPDQARDRDLPSSPLKEGESRADILGGHLRHGADRDRRSGHPTAGLAASDGQGRRRALLRRRSRSAGASRSR